MVFFKQAGTPTEAFGDPAAFDTDVWLVKGVDKDTSADTVEAIQARIQVLLNDTTLSISGAELSTCVVRATFSSRGQGRRHVSARRRRNTA